MTSDKGVMQKVKTTHIKVSNYVIFLKEFLKSSFKFIRFSQ